MPARGLIEAIGLAGDVLMNEDASVEGFAIPCTTVVKNDRTIVIVGGGDETVFSATNLKILYGAYNNYITSFGVSASWNGLIIPSSMLKQSFQEMITTTQDSLIPYPPDNLVNPASEFIFVDKDTKAGVLSEDEAVKR